MTWLYLLNRCVLQWLFVRLCRVLEHDGRQTGWRWMVGVMPTSGWDNGYRFVRVLRADPRLFLDSLIAEQERASTNTECPLDQRAVARMEVEMLRAVRRALLGEILKPPRAIVDTRDRQAVQPLSPEG